MQHHELELIVPLGTSLVGWYERVNGTGTMPPAWKRGAAADAPTLEPPAVQQAVSSLRSAEGGGSCAELDSVEAWVSADSERAKRVRALRLIQSDTEAGRWVAEVLSRLIADRLPSKVEVTVHAVPRLAAGSSLGRGLRGFVHLLGQLRRDADQRGRRLVINATAGYKAESGLALLFGALSGSEVFYRHEAMATAVSFPPFPLEWALDAKEQRLLRELGGVADTEAARELELGQHPRLWPFVEEDGGLWGLTALGELLLATAPEEPVELRDRQGEVEFLQKDAERGHAPANAELLATQIGKELPFVERARLVGWPRRGGEGLLREAPDEATRFRIGLAYGDGPYEGTKLQWLLDTTARDEREWRYARRRVADVYGRRSLGEQLSEDAVHDGAAPAEFEALALEEKLERRLRDAESAQRSAEQRADETQLDFDRQRQRWERQRRDLEGSLSHLKRQHEHTEAELRALRKKLERTAKEAEQLREKLRSAEGDADAESEEPES